MVEEKFSTAKEKAKEEVQKAAAVSLTADMWTSMNMEAYLGVTCQYITGEDSLNTVVLGVEHFPLNHTAHNLAHAMTAIMEEWGIRNKVSCLVTDAAANMKACARVLQVRHSICVAHALNLIVRKSFDQVPALADIQEKARKIVTYFRTSTAGKERLGQIQGSMRRPKKKLLIEVETRWNSTLFMLERLFEQHEAVGAALASLNTDIMPLSCQENEVIQETSKVLGPFQQATVELSEEMRVSGTKIIPLMKMVHHTIQCEAVNLHTDPAKHLADNLLRRLKEHLAGLESVSVMTLATLLGPRFKDLGFHSPLKANEAVKRLRMECGRVMHDSAPQMPQAATYDATAPGTSTPSSGAYLPLHDIYKPRSPERDVLNIFNSTLPGTISCDHTQSTYLSRKLLKKTQH
ncbi:hypothetical protein GJAV_G00170380 [Gymnothorax javanicus]|nr:hypothetical protein GJAV_G00170380 [Gymnothorax javanicus]